jgi:molybdopterin molybdotransferase
VLSTGDELVVPGSQLSDASVYDSNSSMLPALLRANGAEVVRVDLLPDDRAAITSWLREFAPTVDAIVTSGGASVGERDWMRTILVEDGELHLWRVALKPGKPFAFGSFDSTPVFALPGNPASVLACTHAFVKPALRLMSGGTAHHSGGSMRLTEDLHAPRDRAFLFPVRVEGDNAIPVRAAGSSTLVNHLQAEAYAIVEPGGMKAGDEVTVEFF